MCILVPYTTLFRSFDLYGRYPIALVRGKGSKVWDDERNEYIDALGGIAVNNLGHCHPDVVKAIQKQAEKLIHVSNFYYNEPQSNLAEKLVDRKSTRRTPVTWPSRMPSSG